ncbi:MAG: choice-of-anchor D domain-containing protein [Saprospirales bacterium]|nr:choice-of-anchor D domain-containing protein [Saprospirales bacterium]
MKNITILFGMLVFSFHVFAQDPIFVQLPALQCDSLIQANVNNPNFVILDVRTPGEYNPQHLEGAINRNFFDADFLEQLDQLNKQKTYLIHCKSGSRSGSAFISMQSMGFVEVYNMIGGINAWNSQSLPTTAEFAPRLLFVSDSIIPPSVVTIGEIDTINVILTNRANDTLQFASVSSLDGTEFFTDFNLDTTLLGAEDYLFRLFYQPTDEQHDTLNFSIVSNGGDLSLAVQRTGLSILPELTLVSDPAVDFGLVDVGKTDSLSVIISNTGLSDLTFTEIDLPSSDFNATINIDTIIPPDGEYLFFIYYTPVEAHPDSVTITIKSNGGEALLVLKGTGNETSNVAENTSPKFKIYPNPAFQSLNIEGLPAKNASCEIIYLTGQLCYKKQLNESGNFVDISTFQKGIYFVKIVDGAYRQIEKLVIE